MIINILGVGLLLISILLVTTKYRLEMVIACILGLLLICSFNESCDINKSLTPKEKIEAHDEIMRQIEFTRQLTIPFYF